MYQRILLKLSGEALMGQKKEAFDGDSCLRIASEIKEISSMGVQVGLVLGGGNLFRGAKAFHLPIPRPRADQIGMLATMMNGIVFQETLRSLGVPARLMSAVSCSPFVESYDWQEALCALDANEVVIFVGGTGNPYFTTDTAAALRAIEIKAQILLKATTVDGIYDRDPKESSNAVKYERVSYAQVVEKWLKVMDLTAIALCRENQIPIRVFDLFTEGNFKKAVSNQKVGTLVEGL